MTTLPSESPTSPVVTPLPSVILVTPDNFQTIRKTVQHVHAQTVRDKLEVVIVAPTTAGLQVEQSLMDGFARTTIVEAGPIESIGRANALGVRRAAAQHIVLAEDHCFPEPDWAERLLAAHDGRWAVVGPGVQNANPRSRLSWADLLIGYSQWIIPAEAREVDILPGHNSCYQRELLLSYSERLETMMETETLLHWDLRAKGHRLFHQTEARVSHTNFSRWSSWIPLQFCHGRQFAGSRALGMSPFRRMAYVCGAPLIPAVRLARIVRNVLQRRSRHLLLNLATSLPVITVGLVLDGCGQMAGYTVGPGNAQHQLTGFEFHRNRHITRADREALLAG